MWERSWTLAESQQSFGQPESGGEGILNHGCIHRWINMAELHTPPLVTRNEVSRKGMRSREEVLSAEADGGGAGGHLLGDVNSASLCLSRVLFLDSTCHVHGSVFTNLLMPPKFIHPYLWPSDTYTQLPIQYLYLDASKISWVQHF